MILRQASIVTFNSALLSNNFRLGDIEQMIQKMLIDVNKLASTIP